MTMFYFYFRLPRAESVVSVFFPSFRRRGVLIASIIFDEEKNAFYEGNIHPFDALSDPLSHTQCRTSFRG